METGISKFTDEEIVEDLERILSPVIKVNEGNGNEHKKTAQIALEESVIPEMIVEKPVLGTDEINDGGYISLGERVGVIYQEIFKDRTSLSTEVHGRGEDKTAKPQRKSTIYSSPNYIRNIAISVGSAIVLSAVGVAVLGWRGLTKAQEAQDKILSNQKIIAERYKGVLKEKDYVEEVNEDMRAEIHQLFQFRDLYNKKRRSMGRFKETYDLETDEKKRKRLKRVMSLKYRGAEDALTSMGLTFKNLKNYGKPRKYGPEGFN